MHVTKGNTKKGKEWNLAASCAIRRANVGCVSRHTVTYLSQFGWVSWTFNKNKVF